MFTVDTRKQHCQIRIAYCGANPTAGPIHASEIADRIYLPRDYPIAIIAMTEYSDYSGGDVQMSNHRVLSERADEFGLFSIIGSHGYQALAYDATLGPVPGSDDLCDILEGLEGYALIDDDDHSELESELESEAWDSDGRQDFINALPGVFTALAPAFEYDCPTGDDDDVLESEIDSLWHDGCDVFNVNGGTGFVVETGGMVHFYIDDWCEKAGLNSRQTPEHMKGQRRDRLIERILHMAERCRVAEYESDGANEYPEGSGARS